ncbi:hypothetical protein M9H77_06227 [Catharanthus roseus]|uniref:Uncharacterized protein n=1 Tax=Catharanthus roseus TaxID=4058 RepID=A0ACC0BRH9_CATRO|nr:hypothetical protein M9H77_06227 [Catharanthus roseus]
MKKKAETIFGPSYGIDKLNRTSFPKGFLFGAASSAYQIEGAWNVDGKGPSNWDYFTHKYPDNPINHHSTIGWVNICLLTQIYNITEKIADGNNGDVAADSYHLYKKDIALLKGINMDSYRFSIAWSRILPSKTSSASFELNLSNNLLICSKGITPIVTLFHWDVPQALEEEYGGFLSNKIVRDFCDYANICFERFGDRVKHWITLNEPSTYSIGGYESGSSAPGRCSSWMNKNCTAGISGNELYIVTHTQILAHAAAVQLYKTKYQAEQKGGIGITVVSMWMEPLSNSSADRQSAIRQLDFMLGWLMNPIVYGDYPDSMRRLVGSRLPKFTTEEAKQVKGSYDFIGLNYYSALYVSDATATSNPSNLTSYFTDSKTNLAVARNGKLIGEQTASNWFYVYPQGIHKLLIYTKKTYKDPVIYITENGIEFIL